MNYHENLKRHYLDVRNRLRQGVPNIAPDPAPIVKEVMRIHNFSEYRSGRTSPEKVFQLIERKYGFHQSDIFYGPSSIWRNIARSETVHMLQIDAGMTPEEIGRFLGHFG